MRLNQLAVCSLLMGLIHIPAGILLDFLFDIFPQPCQLRSESAEAGLGFFIVFGMISGLFAVVLGYLAGKEINRRERFLKGLWLARIGMVLGVMSIMAIGQVPKLLADVERGRLIQTLKNIHGAEVRYRTLYPDVGYSLDLQSLGPPPGGAQPSADQAGLLTFDLAKGRYCEHREALRYTIRMADNGKVEGFTIGGVWNRVVKQLDETGELRTLADNAPEN